MAKMCGMLVCVWISTLMTPRSVTATPALFAAIFLPLGVRSTACGTAFLERLRINLPKVTAFRHQQTQPVSDVRCKMFDAR